MKIFYGWRIVGAGGALQFLQSLLLNQAFGAYLAVLVDERGWSKTALAGAAAMKSTETAVLGPVLGWMVDRFGARDIVRAGIVLFGIGFMLLSRIETLTGFYGAFVVILAGLFADWTGNYRVGFTLLAALSGLGSVFFVMAKRPE
ncbi:MAG: hypothetical protein GEV05_20280 [Betaproteobacteria bacterium]|nr:hypothetical protein [Betaproteobacteria bacterium]